ncbi:MAG: autotransporter outer membrane beta-barrel domain-containing protein [Desulfocapsa sp.]|nr:autotransporter outer membrane beta-barrel domain-containing protein [Desulfocapsa sp.]
MLTTEMGGKTGCNYLGHVRRQVLKPDLLFLSRRNCCVAVFFVILAGLSGNQPGHAQSLDKELESLLGGRCEGLKVEGLPAPGGELDTLCEGGTGGSGVGNSAGGGSSTPQGAPGIVQERLKTARGEEDVDATGASTEFAPGLSLFFSGEYESLDRDVTDFENGYDSDIGRLTAGADYQVTDTFLAGLAVTYDKHDGDFTGGGDFNNDSYGFTAFASFTPLRDLFVQATAGYAAKNYDRTRIASFTNDNGSVKGPAQGEYDGDEFSAGIMAGYDYTIGSFTIGPRLGLDVINTDFDSYTETGSTGIELVFDDADETSLQSRLGITGSMAFSTSFGVLIPQFSGDWVYEFEDDQRTESFSFAQDINKVSFQYQDEEPDREFFELAAGVSAILPNGWMPYAQFRTIVGHEFLDSYVGTLGIRIEL